MFVAEARGKSNADRMRADFTSSLSVIAGAARWCTAQWKHVHISKGTYVQMILSLLTSMFCIVAILSLLDGSEEACNAGGRSGTTQPHNCAAAFAMHAMSWQAYCQ